MDAPKFILQESVGLFTTALWSENCRRRVLVLVLAVRELTKTADIAIHHISRIIQCDVCFLHGNRAPLHNHCLRVSHTGVKSPEGKPIP